LLKLVKIKTPVSRTCSLRDSTDYIMKGYILLTLATGFRSGELTNLDRRSLKFASSKCACTFSFVPNFLRKFETIDNKFVHFPINGLQGMQTECSRLCPVNWLTQYLGLFSISSADSILFAHPRSGRPLTSQVLSRWFKEVVYRTVRNSKAATSHDLRRLAASIALLTGALPMPEVLARGLWGSEEIFRKHYLRECSVPVRVIALGKVCLPRHVPTHV
jgi:hypothetical protein